MDVAETYLRRVREAFPELAAGRARLRGGESQFNTVLVVDEALIFRFPRGPQAAAGLADEVALLDHLAGRLPLPTPRPLYRAADPRTGGLAFIGYPMLPGQPLWRETLAAIGDGAALDRMALQLAGFLRALHGLPAPELPPAPEEAARWAALFDDFERELFALVRPDARAGVLRLRGRLLAELRRGPPPAALRHGDFGGGNLLYDPQTLCISAVIDFGAAGLGDPAADVAALSTYGEAFLARGLPAYPAMAAMLPRARLYRQTFALQQALHALRAGDRAELEDGLREYV
jgi:aminoglycoside 2''-phosphotransferase